MEDVRARWGGGKKKKGREGRWMDVVEMELKRMGRKGGKGRRATLAREWKRFSFKGRSKWNGGRCRLGFAFE
jgi:hypothetical protein